MLILSQEKEKILNHISKMLDFYEKEIDEITERDINTEEDLERIIEIKNLIDSYQDFINDIKKRESYERQSL